MRGAKVAAIVGGVVLLFFVLGLIGYAVEEGTNKTASFSQVVTSTSSSASPTGIWRTFMTFSGAGDKNTQTFSVSGTVRLIWNITTDSPDYAAFSIYVYQSGNNIPIDSTQSGSRQLSDVGYLYLRPSQYYLRILTANLNGWQITLQETS